LYTLPSLRAVLCALAQLSCLRISWRTKEDMSFKFGRHALHFDGFIGVFIAICSCSVSNKTLCMPMWWKLL